MVGVNHTWGAEQSAILDRSPKEANLNANAIKHQALSSFNRRFVVSGLGQYTVTLKIPYSGGDQKMFNILDGFKFAMQ